VPSRIFYSWQSDLPNNINRGFIEKCLMKSLQMIKKEKIICISSSIDRDTFGTTGSPDIENEILSKIDEAFIFVGDVSIINKNQERLTPNPNILFELGYATKSKGLNNILMVQNLFYGGPDDLPFDLRGKRVITYNLQPDAKDKSSELNKLSSKFKAALTPLLQKIEQVIEIPLEAHFLFNNRREKISIKLHPTWNFEQVFNCCNTAFQNNPNKEICFSLPDFFTEYRALDIANKKWIDLPEICAELSIDKLAFVHNSNIMFFKELDIHENAKAIAIMIET